MIEPEDTRLSYGAGDGGTESASHPDGQLLAILLNHQCQAWRRGEGALVEAYLAQEPALRADVQATLDLIYQEIMLREETGESPDLGEYLRRFPELETELRTQFEVENALDRGALVQPGGDATEIVVHSTIVPTRSFPTIPGYEILCELGHGGMGIVYQARQLRLNRIVAIKMILAGDFAPPDAVERFVAEAESIAKLHHPNIVQIFALGECGGRTYFEMEYVAGGSLADRIGGTPWPVRDASRLIETLARAIGEAHRLAIVHRDLKPANILLSNEGTPKIADFGLAKCLDTKTRTARTEWIVGSPSYMAPEQAGRRTSPIGPPADVYSLGATLYELLTGRPPFQATTVLETLELLRSSEPIAPTRLRPRLPRDLVTICLKCLEKDPARRYSTGSELAEDLRRFDAGETISARAAGWHERVWRWCRREPAVACLAIALFAGLVGVLTQWLRAESHLQEALHHRGRAEQNVRDALLQRSRAEANARKEAGARHRAQERFDAALKALGRVEEIANDASLLREHRLEGLRANLLQTALGFYKELQESLEEDAAVEARLLLSEAYARAAFVTSELGRQQEALAAYRRSLALVEHTAAAAPEDSEIRFALARSHSRVGYILRLMGSLTEAFQSYEAARVIQERLASDNPGIARYRAAYSWTLSNLGVIDLELGRPGEAIRLHEKAMAVHEELVAQYPGNGAYRSDLGWCWRYLCQALAASGEWDPALRFAEQAVRLYEPLARADPGVVEHRWRLARCLDEVSRIRFILGGPSDGTGPLERASELHEALARDNPVAYSVDVIRNRLYGSYQRSLSGRPQEAAACNRKVEEQLARAPHVRPELLLYDLACSHVLWSSAGREGTIASTEREARTQRALAALRRAFVAGHVTLDQIRRDPILNPLRSRCDFQELIMDLSFPVDAFEREPSNAAVAEQLKGALL
jgi:tetratricopeptide (TPR) repeat protein